MNSSSTAARGDVTPPVAPHRTDTAGSSGGNPGRSAHPHAAHRRRPSSPTRRVCPAATSWIWIMRPPASDRPSGGGRRIEAEVTPMHGLTHLAAALGLRAGGRLGIASHWCFATCCNEVEQTAAYLRQNLPYELAVFVHYSNLYPALRRDVEDGFAGWPFALPARLWSWASAGSVSMSNFRLARLPVTLFLQRIGRRLLLRKCCVCRRVRFRHLVHLAQVTNAPFDIFRSLSPGLSSETGVARLRTIHPPPSTLHPPLPPPLSYAFRPSVQQVFSILKQSPTGGMRLMARVAPDEVADRGVGADFWTVDVSRL